MCVCACSSNVYVTVCTYMACALVCVHICVCKVILAMICVCACKSVCVHVHMHARTHTHALCSYTFCMFLCKCGFIQGHSHGRRELRTGWKLSDSGCPASGPQVIENAFPVQLLVGPDPHLKQYNLTGFWPCVIPLHSLQQCWHPELPWQGFYSSRWPGGCSLWLGNR